MNKNVSVWRGTLSPPTHSHIWIVNDNTIKIYRDGRWVHMLDEASEEQSGLMSMDDKKILNLLNENLHWN